MRMPDIKTTILVTGGAGYIGSHVARELLARGYGVAVFDRAPVPPGLRTLGGPGLQAVQADLAAAGALDAALDRFQPLATVHLAGDIAVGESVENPGKYYRNNIVNGIRLLDALAARGQSCFVFSSSAAVYGMPRVTPIPEDHPTDPMSPYGRTKLIFEQILRDYGAAHGLRSTALRYFNAAGADASGLLGEAHSPETHLVPLVLRAALGLSESIRIFGTDYPTRDGTCVRDYIHVSDLAAAHVLAVEALLDGAPGDVFNLGNGEGHSVREVIAAAEAVAGRPIKAVESPRRSGDPAALVASSQKAMQVLGWRPKYHELETIIRSAWSWHSSQRPA